MALVTISPIRPATSRAPIEIRFSLEWWPTRAENSPEYLRCRATSTMCTSPRTMEKTRGTARRCKSFKASRQRSGLRSTSSSETTKSGPGGSVQGTRAASASTTSESLFWNVSRSRSARMTSMA